MSKAEGKILVVDDDPYILLSLTTLLEQHYATIQAIKDPEQVTENLSADSWDVILLDMNFKLGDTSGEEGIKWLKKILDLEPAANIIMITAYGDVNNAVRAMKLGAIDFITKPWHNEKLLGTVSSAYRLSVSRKKVRQLQTQKSALSSAIDSQYPDMIGESKAMKQVIKDIEKVATTDANVIILGENGTGKELIAREIHRRSMRRDEVFISVDLGALSESLFESELFGHQKGAFTDATEDRTGRFEAASGGTLFLDELGNLSLALQSKLLSVLQTRQIYRVGSNKPVEIDIRLICATNQPINKMVNDGQFRQDLLYRINTIEIDIPPLRDRPEDITLITRFYLSRYKKKYRKEKLSIPDYVIKKLQKFDWPGNIRELQHALERAVIMSDGNILKTSDFQFLSLEDTAGPRVDDYNLMDLEKWAISSCLKKHGGNVTRAADELGVTRGALYRRIEKHGI